MKARYSRWKTRASFNWIAKIETRDCYQNFDLYRSPNLNLTCCIHHSLKKTVFAFKNGYGILLFFEKIKDTVNNRDNIIFNIVHSTLGSAASVISWRSISTGRDNTIFLISRRLLAVGENEWGRIKQIVEWKLFERWRWAAKREREKDRSMLQLPLPLPVG